VSNCDAFTTRRLGVMIAFIYVFMLFTYLCAVGYFQNAVAMERSGWADKFGQRASTEEKRFDSVLCLCSPLRWLVSTIFLCGFPLLFSFCSWCLIGVLLWPEGATRCFVCRCLSNRYRLHHLHHSTAGDGRPRPRPRPFPSAPQDRLPRRIGLASRPSRSRHSFPRRRLID